MRPPPPKGADRRRALLAAERGTVVKDPGGRLRVALLWPGSYRTAMASLGLMWVHGHLLRRGDALAERFFDPGEIGGVSLETGRRLADFDLVAASLAVEDDYFRLPAILSAGGLPPFRRDRTRDHPLVLAGGVGVWSNPWPVMPFLDAVLLGEGESAWPPLADLFASDAFRRAGRGDRLRLLSRTVPGILVPGLWPEAVLDGRLRPIFAAPPPGPAGALGGGLGLPGADRPGASPVLTAVRPAFLAWPPPDGTLPPVSSVLSPGAEFADTALVEISRGCPWGCRFCLAGYLYRPHRAWPAASILSALRRWAFPGGRVGLVSPAVADHPDLPELLDRLGKRGLSVGVSSMRLSDLTEDLAGRLSKAGLKGLAVAPEGGSARLRAVVNKNLSEAEILASARRLADGGLTRLKLYFMIGLPTETDDDLAALAELAGRIRRATRVGRRGPALTVSAANFTPKPHTPFEDAAMATERELRRRGRLLGELMARLAPGVELRLDSPKWSLVQGLLARGGPGSAKLTEALWRSEGRAYPALAAYGYGEDDPVHRHGDPDRPWRLVAPRAGVEILASERSKADRGILSEPCPPLMGCGRCGACRDPGGGS